MKNDKAKQYWRENLKYLLILLTIWFSVSYGAGIIFRSTLDQFYISGFPLGFWFAQQRALSMFLSF